MADAKRTRVVAATRRSTANLPTKPARAGADTPVPGWLPDANGVFWAHRHPAYRRVVRALRAAYALPLWAIRAASYGHPEPWCAIPQPNTLRDFAAEFVVQVARTGERQVTPEQLAEGRRILRNMARRYQRAMARRRANGGAR